jgi:hypothetical protein
LLLGCSDSTIPPVEDAYDSKQAGLVLAKALDAWQAGKADALPRGTPPIRFVDDDRASGRQLLRYQFKDSSEAIRPFRNVAVILSLRDARGNATERTVTYQVTLAPHFAVLRGD